MDNSTVFTIAIALLVGVVVAIYVSRKKKRPTGAVGGGGNPHDGSITSKE